MSPARGAALWPPDARSHTPRSCVRRLCQARLRQPGEQYVAEAGRSTPTVHDAPHSGQLDVRPAWTAPALARARRIRRQCRDRHADEQNTAVAFAAGISGPPHPRHSRGPVSSSTTTTSRSRGTPSLPMPSPYETVQAAGNPGGLSANLRPTKGQGRQTTTMRTYGPLSPLWVRWQLYKLNTETLINLGCDHPHGSAPDPQRLVHQMGSLPVR
jgi:hypothetical protein